MAMEHTTQTPKTSHCSCTKRNVTDKPSILMHFFNNHNQTKNIFPANFIVSHRTAVNAVNAPVLLLTGAFVDCTMDW